MNRRASDVTAYWGRGSGPEAIFVHGNGSTHNTWDETIRKLSNRFRCISYDLRGHGRSAPLPESPTIDLFVDDLETLRNHIGSERFWLVGHSLGSCIAAAYTRRYPERVDGLCLIATPARRTAEERRAAEQLMRKLSRLGLEKTIPELVRNWYTTSFAAAHPESLQRRIDQIMSIGEDTFLKTYRLYIQSDIDPWLHELGAPTLVMTGEHALASGARTAKHIAERIPNATLVVFPEMKNGLLTEIPARVAGEIARYREAVTRARA